jgi:hypothetical protein
MTVLGPIFEDLPGDFDAGSQNPGLHRLVLVRLFQLFHWGCREIQQGEKHRIVPWDCFRGD